MSDWRTRLRRYRVILVSCLWIGASACQPGHGGSLDPAPGQQTSADGPTRRDGVSLVSNHLAIEVSGGWHSDGPANSFNLYAVYRNLGNQAVVLDSTTFAVDRGRDRGAVLTLVDLTGVDLTDDRADNDDATMVVDRFNDREGGPVRIAPGEQRTFTASAYLTDDAAPLEDGQRIVVTVPTVRGSGQALFDLDGGWF